MSDESNTVVTLKVRVTPEFRERIVDAAKENSRSMNAEIVHRLEQSFSSVSQDEALMWKEEAEALMRELKNLLLQNRSR